MFISSLLFILASISTVFAQVLATYHDYEGDRATLGRAYDNSPGWCGIRYSVLNVARITAVNGLGESMCNQCLEVQNANGGPIVYVLAVDQKQGPGLDIARSSYAALTPAANPLDPQQVRYRVVDHSNCAGICQGTADECTPGRRNLLPANLLPPGPFVGASLGGSPRPAERSTPAPPTTPQNSNAQPQSNQSRSPQSQPTSSVVVTSSSIATSTASPDAQITVQAKYGSLPEPIYGVMEHTSASYWMQPSLALLCSLFVIL
jgi:hypothetical protein